MIKRDLAMDFSKSPFGRYPSDDKLNCGERFRDSYLVEWLNDAISQNETLEVNLDNIPLGIGSSFLEESFGGLIRKNYFSIEQLERHLIIKSEEEDTYPVEIWGYIREANNKKN